MIQITDAQIHNLSELFHVSKDFVIEVANKVNTQEELKEILYNNMEYAEKFNLDKEIIEDAQLYKLQIEKENNVKLDFGKPIKFNLKTKNHTCIFTDFSEDNKPCSICPLHTELALNFVLESLKEMDLEFSEENIQKHYDMYFDYIMENKEKIVNDITTIIKDNELKF